MSVDGYRGRGRPKKWERVGALSLYKLQQDSSATEEDDAVSNIALKVPVFNYEAASKKLPYLDAKLDNPFSNIPENEFILDTSVPEQSVPQTKNNVIKHLSRYLTNSKPAREPTDYELILQNNIKAPSMLSKTLQSICSEYMNALQDLTSPEKLVSDANLELITYLCEELATQESIEEVDKDEEFIIAQYVKGPKDDLWVLGDMLQSKKCDCEGLDLADSDLAALVNSPSARDSPCYTGQAAVRALNLFENELDRESWGKFIGI